MTMLGPGMYSQSTGPCSDCGGSGEQIEEKNKCKNCNGKKVIKEKKVLECSVDKGKATHRIYDFSIIDELILLHDLCHVVKYRGRILSCLTNLSEDI